MNNKSYLKLIDTIKYHDNLYYNLSQPEITDSDYDALYFDLQKYEAENPTEISKESPTQQVSKESVSDKIAHPFPLLSLKKANTYSEVEKYLDKFLTRDVAESSSDYQTDQFLLQLKEDGLTVAMYFNWFDDNSFVAATRGGGSQGQNVSLQMSSFKHKASSIKQKAIVRGEVVLKNDEFDKMNVSGEYMNPRNAVSGIIHTDAPAENITFIAYNIENAEELGIDSEKEMLSTLKSWGFDTPELQVYFENSTQGKSNVVDYIQDFEKSNQRDRLDHDIDGLVIKPNYFGNRREIGFTNHHPKNQLAYKFASPDAITTLRDVVWQVGAKGRLTPVGVFDPIVLLGATITRASLASYGNILKRNIKIGDTVLVRRSNDVIPQIVKSFPEKRTGSEQNVEIPDTAVFNGEFLYDTSDDDTQLLNKWSIFISKDGLDIKKVSGKTIKDLNDNNLIDLNDYSSLWQLISKRDELNALKGWSDLKINNLLNQLLTPIHTTMPKFLYSLAIIGVGHTSGIKISKAYPTFESLIKNNPVIDISDIPEKTINAILSYKPIIIELAKHIVIDMPTNNDDNDLFAGHKFVVTGTAQNKSRDEIKQLVIKNGGIISNTVSKNTDYLIELSPDSNSSKSKKAQQLNIKIIDEKMFDKMLNI